MTASTGVSFRLDLGDVRRLPVAVDLAPQATLVQLLLNAAAPVPSTPLALAVRRSLDSSARFAVSCLSDPRVREIPDVVMPIRPGERASVAAQVEALRSTPGEVLVDQCLGLWGQRIPAVWRAAVDQPHRWLAGFADACAAAWKLALPGWRHGVRALRREAKRIGLAAVTGEMDVFLAGIHSRIRVDGNGLRFDGMCDGTASLASQQLVLVPMLGSSGSLIAGLEEPTSTYICYAPPRSAEGSPAQSRDDLAILLGPVRAEILRFVRRPRTVSELAGHLNCVPSTITYNCDQLAAARLIDRERRGSTTLVSATGRGIELQDLMAVQADF